MKALVSLTIFVLLFVGLGGIWSYNSYKGYESKKSNYSKVNEEIKYYSKEIESLNSSLSGYSDKKINKDADSVKARIKAYFPKAKFVGHYIDEKQRKVVFTIKDIFNTPKEFTDKVNKLSEKDYLMIESPLEFLEENRKIVATITLSAQKLD